MTDDAKYVVLDGPLVDEIYIMPGLIQHDDFVANMGKTVDNVISAGFVSFSNNNPKCYGKSISLGKASRGETDTRLLKRMLRI